VQKAWEGINSPWGKLLCESSQQLACRSAEPAYAGPVPGPVQICLSKFEHRFSDGPRGQINRTVRQSVSLLRPGQRTVHPAGSDRAAGRDQPLPVCAGCVRVGGSVGGDEV